MKHQEIENDLVIDHYLAGRLLPEEEARFEEHYLGCSQCLDQLEAAKGLRRGLRRAVAQDVAEIGVAQRLGWLTRLARSPGAGIVAVAAIITVAGLPAWLFYRNAEQLGQRLDQAQSTIAEQASQVETLAREREAGLAREEQLTLDHREQAGVTTYSLKKFRGSLLGDFDPAQTITLSGSSQPLVLQLDLDRQESGRYRIRLLDAEANEILRVARPEPTRQRSLEFSLLSNSLEAGVYVAHVEVVSPGADPVLVARFSFRVEVVKPAS